ncbi:hypothetical protein ACJRO7_014154 [Eucalyptus globulus]|uniref:Uncharacterized protein n=1 Tax=Eucalyptus globulus TaxID=34317 RepID=A0ABD3KZ69_EUCGL
MKGTSKVIMGATLVMAGSLAIVLGLVLVLLAELYCSLLLRRRRLQKTAATSDAPVSAPPAASPFADPPLRTSPLGSFYAQGVLDAPRSLLFPAVSHDAGQTELKTKLSPRQIGLAAAAAACSPNFASVGVTQHVQNFPVRGSCNYGNALEHLVYISNPIYDDDGNHPNRLASTPFETPDSSPSRLEAGASSSGDDDDGNDIEAAAEPSSRQSPVTPPLTPMKKLPAQACSVPLRDAGSLCTSGSESHSRSINGLSFSSAGTPSTSPSW